MNLLDLYDESVTIHNLNIYQNQIVYLLKLNNISVYIDEDKDLLITLANGVHFLIKVYMIREKPFFHFITGDPNLELTTLKSIFKYLNISIPDDLLERFIFELT